MNNEHDKKVFKLANQVTSYELKDQIKQLESKLATLDTQTATTLVEVISSINFMVVSFGRLLDHLKLDRQEFHAGVKEAIKQQAEEQAADPTPEPVILDSEGKPTNAEAKKPEPKS